MHPNSIFRTQADPVTLQLIENRGFGSWVTNGDDHPIIAAAPFSCLWGANGELAALNAHLMRANPLVKKLKSGACKCTVVINGPDGYVSPDWYGVNDQVPTWNYIDAYIGGEVELRPDSELPDILAELSSVFEARLAPKAEWLMEKIDPKALANMMRAIVPIKLTVQSVTATWKLSQNKSEEARRKVAIKFRENAAANRNDLGSDLRALAHWQDQMLDR